MTTATLNENDTYTARKKLVDEITALKAAHLKKLPGLEKPIAEAETEHLAAKAAFEKADDKLSAAQEERRNAASNLYTQTSTIEAELRQSADPAIEKLKWETIEQSEHLSRQTNTTEGGHRKKVAKALRDAQAALTQMETQAVRDVPGRIEELRQSIIDAGWLEI